MNPLTSSGTQQELVGMIRNLKKRLQEQEELFMAQDEESQEEITLLKKKIGQLLEEIKRLKQERDAVKDELNLMPLSVAEDIKKTEPRTSPKHLEPINESFLSEYEAVQDRCSALNLAMEGLEAKLSELTVELHKMAEEYSTLQVDDKEKESQIFMLAKDNRELRKRLQEMDETIEALSYQLKMKTSQSEAATVSLFDEVAAARMPDIEAKEEKIKALESELAALKRSISINEIKTSNSEIQCLRESLKDSILRGKELQMKLDQKMKVEDDNVVLKQVNDELSKQNDSLVLEVQKLTKMFRNADSRADELAHLQSKDRQKTILEEPFSPFQRSVSPSLLRKKPSLRSASPHISVASTQSSRSSSTVRRGKPIMMNLNEPPRDERVLDFKVSKLSDNSKKREPDHLKSHYDPKTGSFDQGYGHSPTSAQKLQTPKKDTKSFSNILRTPSLFKR